ncbi:PepSY domain-containing protein [Plantactinospora sp. B5E13]|uniref:PepSY domain-containing protein n=1 Tax=Plantactinospora sp. B5E13 TaxID=3153758 RepID=UPI00325C8889
MIRRNTMVLGIGGALAVLAVVGTAIGANAAEQGERGLGAAPVATATATAPATEPGTVRAAPSTSGPSTATTSTGGPSTGAPSTTSPGTDDPISRERAVEIALGQAGGGRVDEVEREREHGRTVWSVEIQQDGWEVEVDVDTSTGDIVKTDRDRDDDRDDRDRDDDDDDDDRDDD